MKGILFILFILLLGWCCFGCGAGEPNHDWRDTLQKPLPDSILVKDTSFKDVVFISMRDMTTHYERTLFYIVGGTWMSPNEWEIYQIRKRKLGP